MKSTVRDRVGGWERGMHLPMLAENTYFRTWGSICPANSSCYVWFWMHTTSNYPAVLSGHKSSHRQHGNKSACPLQPMWSSHVMKESSSTSCLRTVKNTVKTILCSQALVKEPAEPPNWIISRPTVPCASAYRNQPSVARTFTSVQSHSKSAGQHEAVTLTSHTMSLCWHPCHLGENVD